MPIMLKEKYCRQFVCSTHNVNIPTFGDAKRVPDLAAADEARRDRARITPKHTDSIDSGPVRDLIGKILVGSKLAFAMRHSR